MKSFFPALILGVSWAAGGFTGAQTMPGPQTSFPVPGSGLRVFSTPEVPSSKNLRPLRPHWPTPTPAPPRFYPLNPKPKPTPSRDQRPQALRAQGAERVPKPRQIRIPTPGPARVLGPRQVQQPHPGPVSVLGPRQIHYPTLYQDPPNREP